MICRVPPLDKSNLRICVRCCGRTAAGYAHGLDSLHFSWDEALSVLDSGWIRKLNYRVKNSDNPPHKTG